MEMKTSNEGLELIRRHEGCRLEAYRCPAGVLTIGYGHTGSDVTEGMRITAAQATELLRKDVAWAEEAVNRERLNIGQRQFDALVSFVYNVGAANFKSSTLLRKIKANPEAQDIRDEFAKWNKTGGRVLPGLTARRKAEADLYFKK